MNILFGSVTGTAENLARSAAKLARARGHEVNITELDEVSMEDLATMDDVLIVVSTYGEGEMPFNAELFWDEIEAAPPVLQGLKYGVLALGDTAYEQFCQAGKDIDAMLEACGATRRVDRVDCDLNYEKDAQAWMEAAIPMAGDGEVVSVDALAEEEEEVESWSRTNPFPAPLLANRRLSGPGSTKDMRHIVLSLEGSGLTYEAGDCVGILPKNDPELVQQFLRRLNKTWVTRLPGYDVPLGELLTSRLEILTPSKALIEGVGAVVQDPDLQAALSGTREEYDAYFWGKDVIDVLNIDPRLVVGAEILIPLLSPLQHRSYSIASTPVRHGDELHLTVAAVRWEKERSYGGVCSTFLADRLEEGETAGLFPIPNKRFRVPAPEAPMIMVGPGTGIAPYLGFLAEREAQGASGETWLYTGDRNRACDYGYEVELTGFEASGALSHLRLAFSRDGADKTYVQHLMAEDGAELWRAIEAGAYIYLCGDAKQMAPDVEAALVAIIAQHGGMTERYAEDRLAQLRRQGRYVKDVY